MADPVQDGVLIVGVGGAIVVAYKLFGNNLAAVGQQVAHAVTQSSGHVIPVQSGVAPPPGTPAGTPYIQGVDPLYTGPGTQYPDLPPNYSWSNVNPFTGQPAIGIPGEPNFVP